MSGQASSGESSNVSGSGLSPNEIMANYSQYLPSYLRMNTGQIPAFANTIAQTGANVVNDSGGRLVHGVSDLVKSVVPGLDLAKLAVSLGSDTSRDAASTAKLAASKAADVSNAIDLSGLSPGEANAVERSTNQGNTKTGNLGLMNPTNVISNALNFGGAFNSKIPLASTAANTLANAANAQTGVSTSFGNTANAGSNLANTFTGAAQGMNTIANPTSLATSSALSNSGLLGQISQGNQSWSAGDSRQSSAGGGISGVCCFIFMEAHHGTMPLSVRRYRDKYYRLRPSIAIGYKKMAKWLVPLMRKHRIVRSIVWNTMISPATKHCEHSCYGWNKTVSHFWLKFWNVYGKI